MYVLDKLFAGGNTLYLCITLVLMSFAPVCQMKNKAKCRPDDPVGMIRLISSRVSSYPLPVTTQEGFGHNPRLKGKQDLLKKKTCSTRLLHVIAKHDQHTPKSTWRLPDAPVMELEATESDNLFAAIFKL